uniref:hypothetical protein n=1 Tax=unclassified Aeromonas TaxID=257493 RepID=UPI0022E112F7
QKAPSVAVTWGWGRCDLMADLGNNAAGRWNWLKETEGEGYNIGGADAAVLLQENPQFTGRWS